MRPACALCQPFRLDSAQPKFYISNFLFGVQNSSTSKMKLNLFLLPTSTSRHPRQINRSLPSYQTVMIHERSKGEEQEEEEEIKIVVLQFSQLILNSNFFRDALQSRFPSTPTGPHHFLLLLTPPPEHIEQLLQRLWGHSLTVSHIVLSLVHRRYQMLQFFLGHHDLNRHLSVFFLTRDEPPVLKLVDSWHALLVDGREEALGHGLISSLICL